MSKPPRTRAETSTGWTILAVATVLIATASVISASSKPIASVTLWPTGVIFALWGTAILSGGFGGRRYDR